MSMEIVIAVLIAGAAVAMVIAPLARGPRRVRSGLDPGLADEVALDREIARYRAALRGGTLCLDCGRANPDDSRFCAECGRRLLRAGGHGRGEVPEPARHEAEPGMDRDPGGGDDSA
ncbi:MAG: zinc-ribbon domain-containing protein [Longimicrobiales bacterium]